LNESQPIIYYCYINPLTRLKACGKKELRWSLPGRGSPQTAILPMAPDLTGCDQGLFLWPQHPVEQVWHTTAAWVGLALLASLSSIRIGISVALPALIAGFGPLVAMFWVKMIAKIIGVWPMCRLFRMPARESNYTTLMMAAGLNFGSISALFGYNYGYIEQAQ
jgi:hypothetical protein